MCSGWGDNEKIMNIIGTVSVGLRYLYVRHQTLSVNKIWLYISIQSDMYIHTHTYVCIFIYTHICMCVCVCIYIYIYIIRTWLECSNRGGYLASTKLS